MSKPEFPLDQLQRWMQANLIRPAGPDLQEQHRAAASGEVEEIVAPSSRMSARSRLAIYQRGYFARLLECMSKQFSVLEQALGEELFRDFAGQYLQLYPSTSYTLGDLGNRFADFLELTRPDRHAPPEERESWPDFMIELARLEWECFKILEEDSLGKGAAVTEREGGRLLFYLPPAIRLFDLKFPSYTYYRAALQGKEQGFPAPQSNFLVLINRRYQIEAFYLEERPFFILRQLVDGAQLGEALTTTARHFRVSEDRIRESWAVWKTQWLKWGMVTRS